MMTTTTATRAATAVSARRTVASVTGTAATRAAPGAASTRATTLSRALGVSGPTRREGGVRRSARIVAKAEEGEGPSTPPPAPVEEEEEKPLWVRREEEKELREKDGKLPFGVYLLASSIVAIASIASIFEYTYQNPIFSVVPPTSFLYKPILGIFVFTGLPLSVYLFYQAITSANELADSMDKQDGV